MGHEVKVGRREAAVVVSKRVPVTLDEIGGVLGSAFGEVYGHLGSVGAEPEGPPFVIYHGDPSQGEPFDVEICAPVRAAVEPPVGWTTQELSAGTFATIVHVGPYDSLGSAYEVITAWVGQHGFAVSGPPREVYLSEAATPPEQTRTIIELPVDEVAAPAAAR